MMKHTVSVKGLDLVYEECGESSRRKHAIILLHGFLGSSHYWYKVCPLLSDKYRIIMPRLRGHGGTYAPNEDYSIEAMADDIYKLIEELDIDKVVLFGHSLGGYVALSFAERYREKLLGLGLIHSTALPDSEQMQEKRQQDIQRIAASGISSYVKQLVPKLFTPSKKDELSDEMEQAIHIGLTMTQEAAIGIIESMKNRPDRSHVLAEADYPILLVAGAEDEIIKPLHTFSIECRGVTDSTFGYPHILENTFENVSHMSPFEVPNQLSRVIANYLKILDEKVELRA